MIPNILNKFEYAGISIPMAVLIWIMIYPMMIKVDFKSIKYISKNPKGLFVTWIVNWLIKPFTMYGIACLFFFVLFRAFIPVELATEYLAGAVLLGAAPCTAMVFVWSSLTQGNPVYTVVQVATNDIIILFAFGPIVKFLLGVSNVAVPFNTIFLSVVLFVVIPLLKLIPPPEILQKNPPIPVETPPRRIPILHTQIPLPIQTRKIPLNRKSAASFICGLDSLPMIRSENPCPKKKVISSSVP